MATNHTANYNLNQWEATDPVLRTDFNADNSKVDAALKSLSTTVQQHTTQISQMQTALSKCGTCTFHYQSYEGDGATTKTLSFPSKPVVILFSGDPGESLIIHATAQSSLVEGGGVNLSWSGATLTMSNRDQYGSVFNAKHTTYHVLALLDASK